MGATEGFRIYQITESGFENRSSYEPVSYVALFVCGQLMSRTVPQVMVISSEGMFQAYNIDLDNGGECSLMKEFS